MTSLLERIPMLRHASSYTVVAGLAIVWIVFEVLNDNYLSPRNLSNLLLQIAVLGTLAIGMVFVLVLGEIDLSVGAIAGVSAAVLAIFITQLLVPAWLAILVAIAAGAAIGLLQGLIITGAGIPSFILTLAGLLVWQGVQLALIGDNGQIPLRDPFIRSIASSYAVPAVGWVLAVVATIGFAGSRLLRRRRRLAHGLTTQSARSEVVTVAVVAVAVLAVTWILNSYFGIPWVFVLVLLLLLAGSVVMSSTTFGRHIIAIGGNKEAARRAGINVKGTTISVFVIISAIAALAGIIEASRQFSASNSLGGGTLQLNAIAAAVIGGTSLFGGRGTVWSALVGAMVMGSLSNGLDLTGQPADIKYIVYMFVLLLAVTVDSMSRRSAASSGAR